MARPRKKQGPQRPQKAGKPSHKSGSRGQQRSDRQTDARAEQAIALTSNKCFFLFGRNSVEAALKNPHRDCVRLIGTAKALSNRELISIRPDLDMYEVENPQTIAACVPDGAPHQGILLEVRPLQEAHLEELTPVEGKSNIILMLDQVTDPHNVGACMRSAAAFGARAIITQDRNSPSESGTLARSAAGGLEILPWLRVANLSHTLDKLRDMGYWHVGLDGHTDQSLKDISLGENVVIVMGSEGSGLRPLVRKHCDAIAKIPMPGAVESLNVSNAAAIALYELSQ